MLVLSEKRDSREVDLGLGVKVVLKPLETRARLTAEAAVRRTLEGIEAQVAERRELGAPLGDLPDVSQPDVAEALRQELMTKHLGGQLIESWSGVGSDPKTPAPVTPERVHALVEIDPIGVNLWREIMLGEALRHLAKKGFGASADGTTPEAKAPDIASPAAATKAPAPKAV